ncbi:MULTISPECIES: hypothetical protein [Cyanophyceae]|uniref:hypothetical protein n=1 Tax=Cyanophyceae TaxID=3028117 RepID=UPI0016869F1B|nr:hypothetical protein [Trichocoleus sp. FACHB-40]
MQLKRSIGRRKRSKKITKVAWKRLAITAGAGLLTVWALVFAYDTWRKRDSWCVKLFYPDGTTKEFYQDECQP